MVGALGAIEPETNALFTVTVEDGEEV